VVNFSITATAQRPDQHFPWIDCVAGEGLTVSLCTGQRSGLIVMYTLRDRGSRSMQVVTGRAITAAGVDSYASGRFGPPAGSCTLDSAGTRTHVTWWNLAGGGIFENARTEGLRGAVITVSRSGGRAFPCP
jgi:hypothetical protein